MIRQHEGGEQGDPLLPLLFSLAIHNSLAEVKAQLAEGEFLFAFLDDVYIVAPPARIRFLYDLLGSKLHEGAGIQLHEGKTRTWNRGGLCPDGMQQLGPDVWCPCGIKILGTLVGSPEEFVARLAQERLDEEEKLWNAIPWVPDLQCAWQILVQCAGPRCHHFLRTMPPSQSVEYAQGHDDGMMSTMHALLGGLTGSEEQQRRAHLIASLPLRLGGHGLRSAVRMSTGAYWSSWADAMHMVAVRLPTVARQILTSLDTDAPGGCLEELQEAARTLDRHGFVDRPTWGQLRLGARPPPVDAERGEWHGWQYHASSASEHHFRETVIYLRSLWSHSGPGAGMRCSDAPAGLNSNCSQSCSERWCWKGFVCHSKSQMRRAHVGQHWTRWGDTELLARAQVC